jgi:cytochrome c-type biogenesis protein CcmH
MMLALILTVLAILAAGVIVAPFLFRRGGKTEEVTGVDVYKDQLAEIERDLEQGTIAKEEADLARVEIERRLLIAARTLDDGGAQPLSVHWQYRMVTGVAAIVVLGAIGIYATVGHADRFYAQEARNELMPQQTATQQTAAATPSPEEQAKQVEDMVKRIEERLAENPKDADAWRVLGWSNYNLGKFYKAIEAYQKAVELQKDNALVRAMLGEAMVKAAGGKVTEEALETFDAVLALKPDDERAHFFKGLAYEQKGNAQAALDAWLKLYEIAPKDADWASDLRLRIEDLAKAKQIDVSARLAALSKPAATTPPHPGAEQRGPSAEDIENAKQMAPEDQNAMVRGMVDGLASRLEGAPDDPNGWIMLIRSHMALNEPDKARAALERASKALAESPETLKQIADAAKVMGVSASTE